MSDDELTLERLEAAMRALPPPPQMPRWKDLTWAQRNMVEREINATENQLIRGALRAEYYRDDDDNAPAEHGEE
jgi:hypothetical protein